MEWQPIETVPRDVKAFDAPSVLLCWMYPDVPGHTIRIGRFFTETWPDKLLTFKIELDYGNAGGWVFTDRDDMPTHWMPLPEPPK